MPIFDLGYRPWEGSASKGSRAWPIFRESLLYTVRTRWLKLLYAGAWAPCLIASVIKFIQHEIAAAGGERGIPMGPGPLGASFDGEFFFHFQIAQFFIMTGLVAFVGPGLVAEDRRANALELYLSRPISRFDYLFGKAAALVLFLLSITFAPILLLWLNDGLMAPSADHLLRTLDFPLRSLGFSVLACTGTALIVMALSSMTRSGAMGTIYWFAIFFFSGLMGDILYNVTLDPSTALVAYPHLFRSLARAMFGLPMNSELPHWSAALTVVGLLGLLSLGVLLRRLRGSEVFK